MQIKGATPIISTSSSNPHLTEKIAIPIGAAVGTITVGGISYLIYKKRKKNNSNLPEHAIEELPAPSNELEELPSQLEQENQAQIQIPPK